MMLDYMPPADVDISRETWQEDEEDEREMTFTVYGGGAINEVMAYMNINLIPYEIQ